MKNITENTGESGDKKSTRQHLKKIPNITCLYRHDENGTYYGIKKHKQKNYTFSFGTTDRKLAERKLKDWIAGLDKPEDEKQTIIPPLSHYFEGFVEQRKKLLENNPSKERIGRKDSSLKAYEGAFKHFSDSGEGRILLDMPINEIKPSMLASFFAGFGKKDWKPRTYNAFTLIVKQVFDVALRDEVILRNPYSIVDNNRQKVTQEKDEVPTIEQCEILAEHIRSQKYADTRDDSADKCEFLHLAALGEAEANSIIWGDVDFENGRINVVRQKTGVKFYVPLFPWLETFMRNLYEKQGKPAKTAKIFNLQSIAQALTGACRRLKFIGSNGKRVLYSPRDLRKARIVYLIRKGIPVELISKFQGHQDNGVLIRKVYSWVFDEGQQNYEKEQLAKLI